MDFKNFIRLVEQEIEKRVEGEYKVKVSETMKNNGLLLTGITIYEQNINISPTIYLDDYYEAYQNEKMDMNDVVEDIISLYEKHKVSHDINISFFTDFEKVKDKIIFKLINYDMNRELLKDVPYISYHDLALVFQCLVAQEEVGNATILIHNVHLNLWHKTKEELYQLAKENTPKIYPYELKNMKDIIMESLSQMYEDDAETVAKLEATDSMPMYVLSNASRLHGATVIVYRDILKDFAKAVGKNLYILPSSVHEGATCFAA